MDILGLDPHHYAWPHHWPPPPNTQVLEPPLQYTVYKVNQIEPTVCKPDDQW